MAKAAAPHALAVRRAAEEAASGFPALLIEADKIAHTVASGLHGRRRAGPGENFWQHRAYAFGDPVNTIDWRQSARSPDRLYVRQNEWEAAAAVHIWRDPSPSLAYASSSATPAKRRRADVIATALAILLAQAGERIAALGSSRRPFHGRGAPARFLEALGLDAPPDGPSLPPVAELRPGARVVLISDFFTEPDGVADAVRRYAAQGAKGALLQIVDPAEEEFPFAGRTEFEDAEGPGRVLFGDAGAVRAQYRVAFDAHRLAIENVARARSWTFSTHRTDRPAETALLALHVALADFRTPR